MSAKLCPKSTLCDLCVSAISALSIAATVVNAENTETQRSQRLFKPFFKRLLGQGLSATATAPLGSVAGFGFYQKLNSVWHRRALNAFMFIVLAHWAEHLAQAYQVYVLGWPRPQAGGFLGLFFPWLVSSEFMHYGYAIVMLVGLWTFRKGFTGTSRKWWTIALAIQFWHHIEHAVLQWQALTHDYWFGSPVPVSFLQILLPKFRVEIHLFYNAAVFIPMVIGMYYHVFPPKGEESAACTCASRQREPVQAIAA